MPKPVTVGVVGCYGAVGSAVVRELEALGFASVRLGGRSPERIRDMFGACDQAVVVDVRDQSSLMRFCDGCQIVVNCAGSSRPLGEHVARAAAGASASFVDAGGDEALYDTLIASAWNSTVAVVSAGWMPGLTGLLPRWLAAQQTSRPTALTAYCCVRDRLTPAAAADYLRSLVGGFGLPTYAIRGGVRAPHALAPLVSAPLPFFPTQVDAYPYLPFEAERLAAQLQLEAVSWYNVIDGPKTVAALGDIRAQLAAGLFEQAVASLSRATELDLFTRSPYQLFVAHLDTELRGQANRQTLVFRTRNTYAITAVVTALTTQAIAAGGIAPGLHFAAEALDPAAVVEHLRQHPSVVELSTFDAAAAAQDEVGEL